MENAQERSSIRAFRLGKITTRKNRRRLIAATTAILLPNIGKYLLSLERVSRWFFNLFGMTPSNYFYKNLRNFVVALLLVGYGAVLYFLYKRFIAPLPAKRRALYGPVAAVCIAGIFLFNVYFLPRQPDSSGLIPTKDWSDRIAKSQAPNGGIWAKAGDPSFPTQVWTTAQALVGMIADQEDLDHTKIPIVKSAFQYIENARHPAPTKPDDFDEGWGLFENSKKSTTEIAAWVTLAYISSLESKITIWDAKEVPNIRERIKRDLSLILQRQDMEGGWRPIKEDGPKFTRTYSTVMALWSLSEARRASSLRDVVGNKYDPQISNAINWLLKTYTTITVDRKPKILGWVPNPNRTGQQERFDGLTAQVLFVLSRIENQPGFERLKKDESLLQYKRTFITTRDITDRFVCSNDRIHDFDLSFTSGGNTLDFVLEGSTLLWFPWSYAALTALAKDSALTPHEQAQATALRQQILDSKVDDINGFVNAEFMYVLAENLYCFSVSK